MLTLGTARVTLAAPAETVVGGPLAGVELPLFPSQNGSPPGHPGAIPEAAEAAKLTDAAEGSFTVQIVNPQYQLYPGSVENWRAYWMRHVNSRSLWDAQSLVKNFVAATLPGVPAASIRQYAAPIYWVSKYGSGTPTGKKAAPVPVVVLTTGNPVLKLDLGNLPSGLHVVRVIGANEKIVSSPFREPQFLTLKVNDGVDGSVNTYRMRISAVDEFYSVAEFYFHTPQPRNYAAELFLDTGSTTDLLVHNVTLDNMLAGTVARPIKKRVTLHSPAEVSLPAAEGQLTAPPKVLAEAATYLQELSPEARLARDQAIWKALPPVNTVGSWVNFHGPTVRTYFEAGSATQTAAQVEAEHGKWGRPKNALGATTFFPLDPAAQNAFLANTKLGLEYTMEDLWARRPLPDPYPYKDDGSGLFFPDPTKPGQGKVLAPIADAIGPRLGDYFRQVIASGVPNWRATGNEAFRRDAAVALVRMAYQYPAYSTSNYLTPVSLNPGPYNRDLRFRQREEMSRWWNDGNPYGYTELMREYDKLFPYIQGNEELARSIGRFVPSVKNSQDVIQLLDVYLVQHQAKRILRYHDFSFPTAIAETAAVLGDSSVTDPWMEWLFTKTYKYPLKPLGLQEMLINGYDRDGTEYRGSSFYARVGGHSSAAVAAEMDAYLAADGNPKYNVRDPGRFPKPQAQTHWELKFILAGMEYPRIGDVTGPEKPYGLRQAFGGSMEEASRLGWRWSKDPKFAWILANYFGRKGETEADWTALQAAAKAAPISRAPWLDNRSRVLTNWAGILESGLQHDDFRFRRSSYLRVGLGYGHHHSDTLDLQVFAHGLPMTVDAGQRTGYSTPSDRLSRVHNTVEVNGEDLRSHSWVQSLSEASGVSYLKATASPPEGATFFQRQVALVDVDEGEGSTKLPPAKQRPDALLPKGVTTANSYTFDVFRVSGGQKHTYNFHGTTEDEFTWNVLNPAPVAHLEKPEGKDADADYLAPFRLSASSKAAGDVPLAAAPLQATWRVPQTGTGSEQFMLSQNYDATAPRKHLRLHLFNADAARALKADMVSEKWKYRYSNLMVQRRAPVGGNLESAFAAIIEPYAGDPFVTATRALTIPDNEADAKRAVALEVKTRNGHTDLLFSDGRPEKNRTLTDLGVQLAAEFALHSSDANGLRLAQLVGGTQLQSPMVRLQLPQAKRTARITAVDYGKKSFLLDQSWPAAAAGLMETGVPGRMTSYTTTAVAPAPGNTSRVQLSHGADYYRSAILSVDAATSTVTCRDEMPLGQAPGLTQNWVATDENATRFWRANSLGEGKFQLSGGAVTQDAFGPAGVLRLWELGPGDTVSQDCHAALQRTAPGTYRLTTNSEVTLSLPARALRISNDGKTWRAPTRASKAGAWITLKIPAQQAHLPLYVQVQP